MEDSMGRMVNMGKTRDEDRDDLEHMLDKHGPAEVLAMLEEIFDLKAEHMVANWNDPLTAGCWRKLGLKLERASLDAKQYDL
jgi:hypothetical protein